MNEGEASRTALRVALRRAAHQIYDSKPLVFEDPLAVQILGTEFARELQMTKARRSKPFSAGLRAFLVARSRFAEDCLAEAYGAGVRQYCLLGAGLDTFGYRSTYENLEVFEVDHPATQAWKRGLLARNGIAAPPSLRFVPIDFEREELGERLRSAGFEPGKPTIFSWLGVVPYLTREAFRATVDFVACQPPGSGVVMDYGKPREALSPVERMGHDSLASRVALAGEPFQLFFTPEEMRAELGAYARVEDLGGAELNARYFCARPDELRIRGTAGRIVCAWI